MSLTLWFGFQKWCLPPSSLAADQMPLRRKGLSLQGLLVNLANPKAISFIGALVPQSLNPARLQVPRHLLIAATLCLTDIVAGPLLAISSCS